jgi:hypothetical protein
LHNEWAGVRYAEGRECVSVRGDDHAIEVDPIGHDDDPIGRDSARLESARYRARDGDDCRRAGVFPSRPRIGSQSEVHAPRYHERKGRPQRRQGSQGDSMRGMRVDNVYAIVSNRSAKAPCRKRIDLAQRMAVDHGQAGLDSPRMQRVATPRRHDRPVSAPCERSSKPERLTFAAAPTTLGIDVHYSESHGAQLPLFDDPTQARHLVRGD